MKKIIRNVAAFLISGGAGICFAMEGVPVDASETHSTRLYDVTFQNPCYPTDSRVGEVHIPNGSMLNFASSGVIGKTIRAASTLNTIPNPLGLTHSGIVINENPRDLYDMVLSLTPSSENRGVNCQLSEKAGRAIIKELLESHTDAIALTSGSESIIRPFTLESDGSASEVLKGIAPHTHIHDLARSLREYSGNIYLRPLEFGIDPTSTRSFLNKYLGRPYEKVTALQELLRSVTAANKEERLENVFCSELAACFYKNVKTISHSVNSSNVIPEMFSSRAGLYDLLKDAAGTEIALKVRYDFSREDLEGTSCWGKMTKCFLGHLL